MLIGLSVFTMRSNACYIIKLEVYNIARITIYSEVYYIFGNLLYIWSLNDIAFF